MTPWTAARQASLSIAISWSVLKFMSIESVMPSNHLILGTPFSLIGRGVSEVSQNTVSGVGLTGRAGGGKLKSEKQVGPSGQCFRAWSAFKSRGSQ